MITFLLPLFFSFRQLELEIVGVFVSNCAISTIYSPKLSKPKMIITTTTNVGTKQTKHTNNCIFFWINIACLFVHSNIAVSAPIYDNLRPKKKTMTKNSALWTMIIFSSKIVEEKIEPHWFVWFFFLFRSFLPHRVYLTISTIPKPMSIDSKSNKCNHIMTNTAASYNKNLRYDTYHKTPSKKEKKKRRFLFVFIEIHGTLAPCYA